MNCLVPDGVHCTALNYRLGYELFGASVQCTALNYRLGYELFGASRCALYCP